MASRADSGGLILCGGRSSRMGYDKLRLRFPDGTLLERMLRRMGAVVQPIVLSLAPGQATGPLPEAVATVKDGVANQGPLWGMAEGFRKLDGQCERVVVMPVDLPFLTPAWIERLLDGMEGHAACAYEHEGFINALTAAYSMRLRPKLEQLVREGKRRPIFLFEGEDAPVLTAPPPEGPSTPHPLMDVDTPEAYRDALLHEGIGRRGAAEVTVAVHTPQSAGNVLPAGYLALYADQAGDVLHWARQLYPELPWEGPGPVRLLRSADADAPAELGPRDGLWRGEHLRLELGILAEPGTAPAAPTHPGEAS